MNRPSLRLRFAALALTGAATIAVAAPETAPGTTATGAAGSVDSSTAGEPLDTASRRVYKVDDVGMIIGGASEDAKAKVRRLPVQK